MRVQGLLGLGVKVQGLLGSGFRVQGLLDVGAQECLVYSKRTWKGITVASRNLGRHITKSCCYLYEHVVSNHKRL